jgi:hypothetical protein
MWNPSPPMTFPIVNFVWALAVFAGAMVSTMANAMAAAETNTKPGTRMRFSHIALPLDEFGTQARKFNTGFHCQDQKPRPRGGVPTRTLSSVLLLMPAALRQCACQ